MENRDELLQEEMPQASLVENPQKPKKSRKKTIVILGAAAAVVLAAVIVLLVRGSATSVAKRLCDALWSYDSARYDGLMAYNWKNYMILDYGNEESFFEAASDGFDTDIHSWRSYCKARDKSHQERLEDSIGKYSVEVDVTKTRKYSVDKMRTEQSNWIDELEENGCFDSDEITAAKKVTVKVKVKGEDEVIRCTYDVYLVKIHGAWKVLSQERVD